MVNVQHAKHSVCTMFAFYGGDNAEAINPYHHALIVGYERSIIEYLEDTTVKLQQALL